MIPAEIMELEHEALNGLKNDVELEIWKEYDEFINPIEDNPVRIEKFLKYLDLSKIEPILKEMYAEEYRFKLPTIAILKTMMYWKLSGKKFLTKVWKDLVTSDTLANDLGFDDYIPDYNTFYHFLIKRLGSQGIKKIFDAFVEGNKVELAKHGITLGEEIGLDMSPIPAKKKDKEADWNGHYEMWCYLWHNMRCMDTNLPIEFHLTNGKEDEAHFLAPFILRVKAMKNIHPYRAYVDCGYTGFENFARLYVYWDMDIICNLAKDWKFSELGTKSELERWYQKLWKEPYFKPKASWGYKLYALMLTNEHRFKQVGMYFRNEILAKYEECPDGYMDHYHLRNRIESHHGTEKRNFEIKNIEAKGIKRTTTHLGMHLISILAISLCRLQNGVTEGLTDTAGLV